MAITSVASSAIYPSPAVASQAVASAAPSSKTASPAVINSISGGTGPGTTSADIQSRINGINGLIQSAENIIWSAGDPSITPEEIAQAQSTEAQHLLFGESATIAFADEQDIQGISFNFLPIDFPAPSGSASSSIVAAAPQAAAAAASSATPPSATSLPVAASSQSQANPQPSTPTLSSGGAATSNAAASIALSVLQAASPQSSTQAYTTQTARQTYDIYA